MKFIFLIIPCLLTPTLLLSSDSVSIKVDGNSSVTYQAAPLPNPKGNETDPGDKFKGSNFIHPLKTPSGFTITCIQPDDHLHHFGLWWPWKFVQIGDRVVNCWEIQSGEGIVEAKTHERIPNGLVTHSDYIDRQSPGGAKVVLHETTTLKTSLCDGLNIDGYFLDMEIVDQVAGNEPIAIPDYRYSGFSIRATQFWDKDNSTILTSAGKGRYSANFSHARWVLVKGKTDTGGPAGVLFLSCDKNKSHPEKLRTWDKQHNGAIYINFNTVMDEPWIFEPKQSYTRNYRLLVFDGSINFVQAEKLWQEYNSKS